MSTIQAGFGRLEITPPLGVPMNGYFYERLVEGVWDPIYVNAVAFKDGEKAVVTLACDLCGMVTDMYRECLRFVSEKTGLPVDAIFIHCTHTHTAPSTKGLRAGYDEQYDLWLMRRMADAAILALKDCKPVEQVRSYQGRCPGVTYPRRLKMKDGRYQTWGVTCDPEIESFAGPFDESLRLVRILREKGEEIVLVNFQSHPDNVSNCMISADFPGFLRDRVEEVRANTKCVFFNGCEGQMIVHNYIEGTDLPKYTRAKWAGRVLAEFVLAHMDMTKVVEGEGIAFGTAVVTNKTKRDSSRMAEAERLIDIHENGDELNEIGPDWVATPLVAEAYMLRGLERDNLDYVDIPVSAVTAGGLAFVGIAGEPFCEMGQEIRKASPYGMTFVCCLVNGSEGYYSTAEAYDQDGYEPRNSRFPKGVAENLVAAANDLLQKLREA